MELHSLKLYLTSVHIQWNDASLNCVAQYSFTRPDNDMRKQKTALPEFSRRVPLSWFFESLPFHHSLLSFQCQSQAKTDHKVPFSNENLLVSEQNLKLQIDVGKTHTPTRLFTKIYLPLVIYATDNHRGNWSKRKKNTEEIFHIFATLIHIP